jgi:hypothetical protein
MKAGLFGARKVGILVSAMAGYLAAQGPVSVKTVPYGDMKIKGGVLGKTVNAKSTLPRQAIIVNDAWCPLEIVDAQMNPETVSDGFGYRISGKVRASKQVTVTAFELNFRIYDPLGNKVKDLYFPFVQDMKSGDILDLNDTYEYTGWLGDAKRAHTTVFWIGAVRFQENGGQAVWRPDDTTVQARINTAHDSLYGGIHREIK